MAYSDLGRRLSGNHVGQVCAQAWTDEVPVAHATTIQQTLRDRRSGNQAQRLFKVGMFHLGRIMTS
jgi:hypothetical protein